MENNSKQYTKHLQIFTIELRTNVFLYVFPDLDSNESVNFQFSLVEFSSWSVDSEKTSKIKKHKYKYTLKKKKI